MYHVTFFLDGSDEYEMTCDIKPDQYTYLPIHGALCKWCVATVDAYKRTWGLFSYRNFSYDLPQILFTWVNGRPTTSNAKVRTKVTEPNSQSTLVSLSGVSLSPEVRQSHTYGTGGSFLVC